MLKPPDCEKDEDDDSDVMNGALRSSISTENLEQHVLSPRLVDAISQTAQVVWANTKKEEGLTGRSDIRLQTAVGMPVAMDSRGNMCIVLMFSPNNVQSTDDAMEYLQSISQSATSSSIPCLLPVFDSNLSNMKQLPPSQHEVVPHPDASSLGEGVTARFVSLDDTHTREDYNGSPVSDEPEVHCKHELSTAPKDTFGIPMLPSFAEFGGPEDSNLDVFDEASYGIWSTIMETLRESSNDLNENGNDDVEVDLNNESGLIVGEENQINASRTLGKPRDKAIAEARKERLEEFCSAFLEMSVFDLADVWATADDEYPECLQHVMSVTSTTTNELLNDFVDVSRTTVITGWSGAVGQAFSSGNPVWSANTTVFVDSDRCEVFSSSKIQTVLAVPVFSGKNIFPTCVVACYSLVRSASVPFVLRFVQQALRLLWDGLDQVEPHESVGKKIWKEVAPADLGEMAADLEMQQHFMSKKRPRDSNRRLSIDLDDPVTGSLVTQLQSVSLPNNEGVIVPLQLADSVPNKSKPAVHIQALQNHLCEAVRSVGEAVRFRNDHVSTNALGTKRAHIMGPVGTGGLPVPQPLHMPKPLPTQVVGPVGVRPVCSASPRPSVPQPITSPEAHYQNGNYQSFLISQQQVVSKVLNPSVYSMNDACVAPNGIHPRQNGFCVATTAHLPGSKLCRIDGCQSTAVSRRPYCVEHSGNRLCEHAECGKCAQGSTRFCIAHGGGRRCTFPGCDKGARDKFFCAAHGGGKRCRVDGCSKSAVGGSKLCTAHGGGRRCSIEGCDKSAQSSTQYCVKHGGGKKCSQEGCEKVARGRTQFCAAHGGGVRCKLDGCNRVAIGKLQLCRAHGGGARPKKRIVSSLAKHQVMFMKQNVPSEISSDHHTSV